MTDDRSGGLPESLMDHMDGAESGEAAPRVSGGPLAACLLFIAKLLGRSATRDFLLSGLPLQGGILTPSVFPRAAKRAGLVARVVRTPLNRLNTLLLPAVLLLEGGNACVLTQYEPVHGRTVVWMPELGQEPVETSLEDLAGRYTGYVIYARPVFQTDGRTDHIPKRSRKGHWFWSVIGENRALYRDLILASVMINIFALAMPLFVMNVYNRVVPNRAVETLWVLSAAVFIALSADFVLRMMRGYFIDLAAVRTNVMLSSAIFEKAMGLRMEEKPSSTGSFASSLQSFESVRNFISSATVTAFVDLPFALLFVGVIALIGWQLAVPLLVGGGGMILYSLAIQGKMRDLSQTTNEAGAMKHATLIENLLALETVKSLGAEGRAQSRWERVVLFLERTGARLRFLSSSVANGAMWCQFSVSVVVMIIGVYLIMDGSLSMGGLIAAYMLSSRAMAPISRTASLLTQYHQSSRSLATLDSIMEKEVERPEGKIFDSRTVFRGDVEFQNVTFRYPDEEIPALEDVSLRIRAGEKVAILGRVGSGKSTLARLILGLYRPCEGEVLADGVDLRQIDPSVLRRHVGYVPQETVLFHGSLRENILLGAPAVNPQALSAALRLAGIENLVNQSSRGLDMPVGERGERLSAGQRQAVSLARALIKTSPLLVMDEPTASMDSASEAGVRASLGHFCEKRTLILVTHKTALLDLVNRLIVMDRGRIVADGPRDEVLQALRDGHVRRGQ